MNPLVKKLTSGPYVGKSAFWKSQRALTYGYFFVHGADPLDLELFYHKTLPELIQGTEYPTIVKGDDQYIYKYPNAEGFPEDIEYPETIAAILSDSTHRWAVLCLLMKGHLGATRLFLGDDKPERELFPENFTNSLLKTGSMTTDGTQDFYTRRASRWFYKGDVGYGEGWGDLNANLPPRDGLWADRSLFRMSEEYSIPTFQSCCMVPTDDLESSDPNDLRNCTGAAITASMMCMHEAVAVLAQRAPKWRDAFEALGLDPGTFDPGRHPREDQSKWVFFENLTIDQVMQLLHKLSSLIEEERLSAVDIMTTPFLQRLSIPSIPIPFKRGAKVSPALAGLTLAALGLAGYLIWRGMR